MGGLTSHNEGTSTIRADIIDSILRDEDPFKFTTEEAKKEAEETKGKDELKISAFVVDIEIPRPVSK